jgi:hypothetical protein
MALSPFRSLAREVRARLTGHWASALGVLLLPAAVLVLYAYIAGYLLFIGETTDALWLGVSVKHWISGMVTVLAILLFLLVLRPMALGVTRWWAALAAGHDLGAGSCLYYFTRARWISALKHTLRLCGTVLLLLVPFVLAVLLTAVLMCRSQLPELFDLLLHDPTVLTMYQLKQLKELLSDACFWVGPLAFFLLLPLFFADYRFVTDRDPSPIRFSFRLIRRCFMPAVHLFLRHFGWIFLSFFVFPLLYTLPYLGMTYAVFCKWMTRSHA